MSGHCLDCGNTICVCDELKQQELRNTINETISTEEKVYMYFNSQLFLIVERGDLIDAHLPDYMHDIVISGHLDLNDILNVSELLGEL